jgi:hypothetical protein
MKPTPKGTSADTSLVAPPPSDHEFGQHLARLLATARRQEQTHPQRDTATASSKPARPTRRREWLPYNDS